MLDNLLSSFLISPENNFSGGFHTSMDRKCHTLNNQFDKLKYVNFKRIKFFNGVPTSSLVYQMRLYCIKITTWTTTPT